MLEWPRQIPIADGHKEVQKAMMDAIREEHNAVAGVSRKRMLVLRVSSPTVPTLDFIDLPGLVQIPRPGEPQDMPEQTRELIDDVVAVDVATTVGGKLLATQG